MRHRHIFRLYTCRSRMHTTRTFVISVRTDVLVSNGTMSLMQQLLIQRLTCFLFLRQDRWQWPTRFVDLRFVDRDVQWRSTASVLSSWLTQDTWGRKEMLPLWLHVRAPLRFGFDHDSVRCTESTVKIATYPFLKSVINIAQSGRVLT